MDQYRVKDDLGALGAAAVVLCFGGMIVWALVSGEAGHSERKVKARQALELRLEYGNTQP